nr:probable serine/threonine-protein kinase DDB_G0282963 [Dermatophagoides farinae]
MTDDGNTYNNNGDIVIDVDNDNNDDDNDVKDIALESGHNVDNTDIDNNNVRSSSSSSNDKIETKTSQNVEQSKSKKHNDDNNNELQMKQLLKFIKKSSPEMLFLLDKSAQLSYQMALFERKLDYLEKIFINNNNTNNNNNNNNNSDNPYENDDDSLLWSKVINRTRAWIADSRKKNIFLTNYELKQLAMNKTSKEKILEEWKTLVAKNNNEQKPLKMFTAENSMNAATTTNELSSYTSLSSKDELIMLLDQIAQFSSNIISKSRKKQSHNSSENNMKQNDEYDDLNVSARDGATEFHGDNNDDSSNQNQTNNCEKQQNANQSMMEENDPKSFLHRLLINNRISNNEYDDNDDECIQKRKNEHLLERLKPDILQALVQIIKTNSLLVQVQREFDILMCAHLKSFSRSLSKQQQQQQQVTHHHGHNDVNQIIMGTSPPLLSSLPLSFNGGCEYQQQLLTKRIKSNSSNQNKLRTTQQQQQIFNVNNNNNGNKSMAASHPASYNCCMNNMNQTLNPKLSQTQTNRMMVDELTQYVGDCCMVNKLSQNNNFVSDGDSGGEFTATTVTNDFNQCVTDDELSSLLNQIALCSQKIIEQSENSTGGVTINNTANSSSNNSTSSSGCCCSTSIDAKCCSISNHHHQQQQQPSQPLPMTPSTLALRSQHYRQIGKDPISPYIDQMMINSQEIGLPDRYYYMNPTGSVQNLARNHANYHSSPIRTYANSMSFNNHHHPFHHHHNHLLNHHDENILDSQQPIFNESMKKLNNCYSSPSSKRILHEQYLGCPLEEPLIDRVSNNMTGFMLASSTFDMLSPHHVDHNPNYMAARHRSSLGQHQNQFHHLDHRQSVDGQCLNDPINDCINPTNAFIFDPNVDVESFLMEVEKELDENRFTSAPPFMNPATDFDNGTPTHHNRNNHVYNGRSSHHHQHYNHRCSSMNRSTNLRDECCQRRSSTIVQPLASSSPLHRNEQSISKCSPGSYPSPLVTNNNATSTMHTPLMSSIHSDHQRNHFNHNNNNENHHHHHVDCSNARYSDHQSLILAGGNWKLSQRNSINDFGRFNISLGNLSNNNNNNQLNGHQQHFSSTMTSMMASNGSIQQQPSSSSTTTNTAMMTDQTKISHDLLDKYRTQVSYRVNEETDRQLKEIDQWLYKHLEQTQQQQQQQSPNRTNINNNNNNSSRLHLNQDIGSIRQQQQQQQQKSTTTERQQK